MTIIDDLRIAGLVDADEHAVLSRVNPATVADAHRKGLIALRLLIFLHARLLTADFTRPFPGIVTNRPVHQAVPPG